MNNENKTITELEKLGYSGIDACLMISLFEYGLAWKDGIKEIDFIYGIKMNDCDFTRFDRIQIDKSIDVRKEYDWAEFDAVESFTGTTRKDWDKLELPQKIFDLITYYGFENVCGSSYWEGFEITQ